MVGGDSPHAIWCFEQKGVMADLLDDLDKRILAQLQADAAISNQELASRVHASAPTCLRRVRRLRNEGVIQRITAQVAPEKVGQALTAIVEVTLDLQGAEQLMEFERRVADETAVLQCYRVSGGPDFVLGVTTTDMSAYQALVQRLLNARANVRNVRTFFAVNRSKFETRVPIV